MEATKNLVKWVKKGTLYEKPIQAFQNNYVPVIPLADLTELVKYLREQVRYYDPLCMDNIEEDGCTCGHVTAQRLLAQLEAQADKEGK